MSKSSTLMEERLLHSNKFSRTCRRISKCIYVCMQVRMYVHVRAKFLYRKCFVVSIIQCRKYFVIFNSVVRATTKIFHNENFRIYGN